MVPMEGEGMMRAEFVISEELVGEWSEHQYVLVWSYIIRKEIAEQLDIKVHFFEIIQEIVLEFSSWQFEFEIQKI